MAEGPFPGGTIVTGPVVELSAEEALIDLAEGKRGIVSRRHWSDPAPDDLTQHCAVGDMVVGAVLVRDDPKGRIVLSRAWAERIRAFEKLQAAYDAKETLTGTVIATVKGGLAVDVGIRAFLPRSVATLESNADLSKLVGETVECRVLEIDAAQNRAVLDRKAVLRAERNAKRNELLSSLTKGEIRTGTVRSIVEFGAFVDLGGAEGLIHISEMAWTRVDNPKDVVRVGQEVTVKVLEVRKSKKRVRLSLRGAEADPLDGLVEGSVVEGKVSRLADFGAFVDVGGVEGLVHLNELSEHRVFAPEEVVMPGEQVYVKVIGINRKRRRVDLSITQAVLMSPPPPADEASDPE